MTPNTRFAAALNNVASLRCFGPVNRIRRERTKEQEAPLHV